MFTTQFLCETATKFHHRHTDTHATCLCFNFCVWVFLLSPNTIFGIMYTISLLGLLKHLQKRQWETATTTKNKRIHLNMLNIFNLPLEHNGSLHWKWTKNRHSMFYTENTFARRCDVLIVYCVYFSIAFLKTPSRSSSLPQQLYCFLWIFPASWMHSGKSHDWSILKLKRKKQTKLQLWALQFIHCKHSKVL